MTNVRCVLLLSFLLGSQASAQTPRDFAVDLSAVVSTNTPCITLSWSMRRQGNISAQKIHRRLKNETAWIKQADLATNQTSYVDYTACAGVEYEYWMERTYTGIYPTTAMGYLSAGVNVPMTEYRGKLLLVVDDTMLAPLEPEIEQLQSDLIGEGWTVETLTASRTNTAANVKAQILFAYNKDPQNVKAVYLLGHVPVPYSGNIAPDGCSDHAGAWPADGYYGEVNGAWTDVSVNNTAASRTQNDNVPGDGKFDQNYFPDFVDLMVGRVDLHGMTRAPSSAVSETMLLRRYLRKAHDFRMRQGAYVSIPRKSLIRDDFGYVSGENSAIAGWAWAFTGVGAQVEEVPGGQWFSSAYAAGKTFLVGYGNGVGSFESANSVGNTVDFGLKASRVVFTSLFGNEFGDWDSANNFLRAPLAGNATGDSLGLTCFWGGRPNRFMHHMGMGETAGYSMWVSHNGTLSGGGGYTPNNYAGVHCGLMGDPTLRLYSVEPTRNLAAVSSNSMVLLAWTPSSETNLLGYHVYRADSITNSFARLTASPQKAAFFSDYAVTGGQTYCYQVRALKQEVVPGGSFYNLSVGTPYTISVSTNAVAAPRSPGGLTVYPYASTNARLAWVDLSSDETGFRVERKVNADGIFAPVGTVSANVTNFIDVGVFTNGYVYYYRVVATGVADISPPSNIAAFDATAGFFDLPSTRVKVYKTAGSVAISVNRIGGSNGLASVHFSTSDSSAFAGSHYVATAGVLTWSDGDTAPKTISVPIINTVAPQAARQFKVLLSAPSSGAGLTVNESATVLIEDPTATLDALWSQTIIGGITDNSTAVTVSNALCSVTIGGSGLSSVDTYDAGQFVYQTKTGDGILTAFFPAGIPADNNARYALMIRASNANNSIMAAAVTSSSSSYGTKLACRDTTGGFAFTAPASANAFSVSRWLRLIRNSSLFTVETSEDGTLWKPVASATLAAMPAQAVWGFFHLSSDWSVSELGNYHLAIAESISFNDIPIPSATTGLVAVAMSPTQVSLSWPAVAYASGYRIERCDEYGSFTQIVDVVSSSQSTQVWEDVSVRADSGYAYRVFAYNARGSGEYSPVVGVTTPQVDIVTLLATDGGYGADATVQYDLSDTPLGLATNLAVAGLDPDSWEMLTHAAKVYFRFDLSGLSAPSKARLGLAFMGSENFYAWNYYSLYFYLLDKNSNGWNEDGLTWNNAPQNERAGLSFEAPCAPLGDALEYALPLEGQPVFFDLDEKVLFGNRATNNWVTIVMTQYDGAAMQWASKEHASYMAPALEVSAPSPLPPRPSFLTAQVESGWAVTLRWQDGSSSETGLELQRRFVGGEFEGLQTLASNTVYFLDHSTAPNTTYEYRLRAVNSDGQSSWTAVVSVTTPDVFYAAGTLWDAGGPNTYVNTPGNWDKDRNPTFDGTGYYNFASAGSCVTVNTNVHFLGMSLHRDADFLFADGGATLKIGAGGVRAVAPSVSRLYTLATALSLGADQYWGVTNSGSGATTLAVSGPISDGASSFGITKSGNGLLILSGNSDYDGITTVVSGGGLRVESSNALGSAFGITDIASNGWLEIDGSVTVPEPLTLRDAGTSGALRSTGGTNVWSGPLTLVGPTRLRAFPDSRLTLSGGVTGGYDLLLSPYAGGEIVVAGNSVNLSSRKVAAYGEGTVTIASGGHNFATLEVAGAGMRVCLGATNALPASSVLSVGASYSAQGIVDLNGFDQTVARLVRGTTGTSSNRIVTSAFPATLTVNETSVSPITYFNGHLTGALGLTKGGAGTLGLIGTNNTYTGDTIVSGGTLEVGMNARLGFSPRVFINAGLLKLFDTNSISDSAMLSVADGGAKVRIEAGAERVGALILGGRRKAKGTWGASGSGAENIDNDHFEGPGFIDVLTSTIATWDAGGPDTRVTTSDNWDFDTLPNFDGSAHAIFGLGGSAATVDSSIAFSGVLLNRNADFTFVDGGGTLSLGLGGLCAVGGTNVACAFTLASRILLSEDQNWGVTNSESAATTLVVSGPVADGASSFGIKKSGNGLLTLSGDNSYDGLTTVAAGGGLSVTHDNGLGSTNGTTEVASNGWLEISGNVTVPEPLTLRDASISGALRSVAGTNVWNGPITLGGPTRLRSAAGSSLTVSGGVSGNFDLFLSPPAGAELAVSGKPVNLASRKLLAYGEGTVTIGSGGHSFATLEVAGVGMRVRLSATNVLPALSTLSVGASYSAQGVVDLCGFDQTVGRLVRGTTGASSNRIVTSSSPATLTVNENSVSPVIYFNGHLTGVLGLTKGGDGTLSLIGTNNTFTGATTVKKGTLEVGANSRLGFSPKVSVTGGNLRLLNPDSLADNATLNLAGGGTVFLLFGSDTVSALYLDGKRQRRGTYGSTSSNADFKSNSYFTLGGEGVIQVQHGPECVLLVQ